VQAPVFNSPCRDWSGNEKKPKQQERESLPILEKSLGYGIKLANREPAWLTMTTVETTAARNSWLILVLFSITAEELERFQAWPL
jgi:hypothetical protein